MRILGFSAKARHGKDTCSGIARAIAQEEFGANVGQFPLALPLKAIVYAELGGRFSHEEVFNSKPSQVRRLVQRLGTDEGRNVFGSNYWVLQVEAFLKEFEHCMPFMDAITIPDVRFPNELDFVRKRGLSLYIVSNRPTLDGSAAEHESEVSLDHLDKSLHFDGIITNNADTSLEDLYEQLRPFVRSLLEE